MNLIHRNTMPGDIPGAQYALLKRIQIRKPRFRWRVSPFALFLLFLLITLIVLVEFCRAMLPILPSIP